MHSPPGWAPSPVVVSVISPAVRGRASGPAAVGRTGIAAASGDGRSGDLMRCMRVLEGPGTLTSDRSWAHRACCACRRGAASPWSPSRSGPHHEEGEAASCSVLSCGHWARLDRGRGRPHEGPCPSGQRALGGCLEAWDRGRRFTAIHSPDRCPGPRKGGVWRFGLGSVQKKRESSSRGAVEQPRPLVHSSLPAVIKSVSLLCRSSQLSMLRMRE
jgi:hypothetical protein